MEEFFYGKNLTPHPFAVPGSDAVSGTAGHAAPRLRSQQGVHGAGGRPGLHRGRPLYRHRVGEGLPGYPGPEFGGDGAGVREVRGRDKPPASSGNGPRNAGLWLKGLRLSRSQLCLFISFFRFSPMFPAAFGIAEALGPVDGSGIFYGNSVM